MHFVLLYRLCHFNPYYAGKFYLLHSPPPPVFIQLARRIPVNSIHVLKEIQEINRINNQQRTGLSKCIKGVENSVDPDQLASEKPADLDLHCLQRKGISGVSMLKVICDFFIIQI